MCNLCSLDPPNSNIIAKNKTSEVLILTLVLEIYTRMEAIARMRGIRPETLINLWLSERLHEQKVG
jgi:hypothetical protein